MTTVRGSLALLALLGWLVGAPLAAAPGGLLLTEIDTIVTEHVYDPALAGAEWSAAVAAARATLEDEALPGQGVDRAVAELLASLEVSHTRRFHPNEAAYYQLLGIFRPSLVERHPELFPDGVTPLYPGIGIATESIEGRLFVSAVYDGQPGAEAGVQLGDEILAVAGEPYDGVASFRPWVDRETVLTVRRQADQAPIDLAITPQLLDAETLFLDAMRASMRIESRPGARGPVQVGYVHIWSYAGRQYHDLLEAAVAPGGKLASADVLVVDLRGGWGGADPDYLGLFDPDVPVLTMIPREGEPSEWSPRWRKPVVVVIDDTSRSGKEILAWGFERFGLGTLVGGRTAGAVVAGRPFVLSDGSVLYLAVADVRVDGVRLEGVGVPPEHEVPFELPHAAGYDPRLERAFAVAVERAEAKTDSSTKD
ncbi:MAG: S41 family peptidase [Acidobacteriota bacterium]